MPQPMLTGGCVRRRILPFLLLALTACGPGAASPSTTATIPSTTSAPIAVTSTTATTPATTTSTPPPNAAAQIRDALEASSGNYRFTSTVTIGEETITTIEGLVDQGSVAATIGTGDREVSYVRTPEGEWVTDAEGEWVDVQGEPPVTPPLSAIGDPESLEVVSSESSGMVVRGILGPAAGEARGVQFTITLTDGLVTEITYQANADGETAVVTTKLADIGSAGEVNPPEGA